MGRKILYGSIVVVCVLAITFMSERIFFNSGQRDFHQERTVKLLSEIRPAASPEKLPNIVIILADDLGYGDLGCYGAKAIRTPNIDRMAQDGVLMTNFYAAMPSCSPSRAAILTGRYPMRAHVVIPFFHSQTTMTGFLNNTNAQLPLPLKLFGKVLPMNLLMKLMDRYQYGISGIPEDEALLPEILQKRGYSTALVGKWHLGDRSPSLPNENGFDFFYGAYCSNDTPPYEIYRNNKVDVSHPVDQDLLTGLMTKESIEFIRANRDNPFFLFLAHPMPHEPMHAAEEYRGQSLAGLYGDTVEELDWSTGEVLKALERAGIDEKTLVIFTSDNGPWWQGSAGHCRGRKRLTMEGGFRVPLIARWPGAIPSGTMTNEIAVNFDLFSTCLNIAGIPVPSDRIIDGQDMLPVLRGETPSPHESIYYYDEKELIGIRQGRWKYMRIHTTDNASYSSLKQGPFLFDLETDPTESYSLIETHPDIARELSGILDTWDKKMEENLRGWLPQMN